MIKKGQLLFLSHVFVAKFLKRYSVAVNLYFFTSCILFYPFQFGFSPQFGFPFFFFFPNWLLSLCYLQNAFYAGNQLLPYCWHQSSVFTLLNFSAVFDPADDYSFLRSFWYFIFWICWNTWGVNIEESSFLLVLSSVF